MEKLNLAGVALAMLAMTACAAEAPPAPEDVERSVVVDQLDDTSLDVTVSSAGDSLRLVVLEVEPRVVDVTFDFGDPMIAFRLDYARGVGDFMPSGAALDARHLRLVDQLGAALTDLLPEDAEARALVEDVALRQTSFMQIVPLGTMTGASIKRFARTNAAIPDPVPDRTRPAHRVDEDVRRFESRGRIRVAGTPHLQCGQRLAARLGARDFDQRLARGGSLSRAEVLGERQQPVQ